MAAKIERLRSGVRPRVLDLFHGCGGFSLGFLRAGCELLGGVEIDPDAAATYAANFHADSLGRPEHERFSSPRDITKQDATDLVRELCPGVEPQHAVDVLIGGPPCPAFARVGRAKLREICRNPAAHLDDPRAQLWRPYVGYVAALVPVSIVMENVPDILNFGGHNLAEEIAEILDELGYDVAYTLLNAAHYGVPQLRQRFLLIAHRRELGVRASFPEPTHRAEIPLGYDGAADVALKQVRSVGAPHWREPCAGESQTRCPGAADALRDLPSITAHLHRASARGRKRLSELTRHDANAASTWSRQHVVDTPWFRVGDLGRVSAHVTRELGHRDYRIFARMKPGEEYPRAYALGLDNLRAFFVALQGRFPWEGYRLPDDMPATRRASGILRRIAERDPSAQERLDRQDLDALRLLLPSLQRDHDYVRIRAAEVQLEWRAFEMDAPLVDKGFAALEDAIEDDGAIPGTLGVDARLAHATALARSYRRFRGLVDAWREAEADYPPGAEGTDRRLHVTWSDDRLREVVAACGDADPRRARRARISMEAAVASTMLGVFVPLKKAFVPPYDPSKFPNRWRKMDPDKPARTLMAHLGKDTYSHIHHDDRQARTITVREAARLQTFPDAFEFPVCMNAGYRMIGNAVPPVLAWRLAETVVAAARDMCDVAPTRSVNDA